VWRGGVRGGRVRWRVFENQKGGLGANTGRLGGGGAVEWETHKTPQAVITKVNKIRTCISCKINNRFMTGLPWQVCLVRDEITYAFRHTFTRSWGKVTWRITEILIYEAYTQNIYKSRSYFTYRTLIPYYNTSHVIHGLPTKSALPQDRTRFSPFLLRE